MTAKELQVQIKYNSMNIASATSQVMIAASHGTAIPVAEAQERLAELEKEKEHLSDKLLEIMLNGGEDSILGTLVESGADREVYLEVIEKWCKQKGVDFTKLKAEAGALHHTLCEMSHTDQCSYFWEQEHGAENWSGFRHLSYLIRAYNMRTMGYSTDNYLDARYLLLRNELPKGEC